MGLQFVIGRPGSGKSHYEYEKAIQDSMKGRGREYVFLVPEQATFQTQQTLLALHPRHAIHQIDVTGFTRMAHHMFLETGYHAPVILDDVGKHMILRRVAARVEKSLNIYRESLDKSGFVEEIMSVISELKQYKITAEQLQKLKNEGRCSALLQGKLDDISLILSAFEEALGAEYMTAEELLHHLARVIPQNEKVGQRTYVVDGFTGFTPIQYDVLEQLMCHGRELVVVLNARDRDNIAGPKECEDLFHMSRVVYEKLMQTASENGVSVSPMVVIGEGQIGYDRYSKVPALGALESTWGYDAPSRKRYYMERVMGQSESAVRILAYHSREREAEGTAVAIRKLVLAGYRYNEIGVIVAGDMKEYEAIIRREFEKVSLPYFIDAKKSIMEHPLVHLIRFVMRMFEEQYSYESVIAYLRCGLSFVGEDRDTVDLLDNYLLAKGKRGFHQWHQEWTGLIPGMETDCLEKINELRSALCEETDALYEVYKNSELTVREKVTALYEYLRRLRIEERILGIKEQLEAQGETEPARQYEQIYGKVIALLDRYVSLMGEECLSGELFARILDCGLMKMKVGLVPPAIDRLVVGDMRRTRFGNIKVLFLLGMNDEAFPAISQKTGILTEQDRAILQYDGSVELAPDGKEELYIQEYYGYLAYTKPSESLICSYARTDGEGKSTRRSYSLDRILEQLPFVEEQAGDITFEPAYMVSPEHDKAFLLEGVRRMRKECGECEENALWEALYDWYAQQEKYKPTLEALRRGMLYQYHEDVLYAATARRLYGYGAVNSITRLERFAACEFSHYLTYGLGLKERQEHRIEARSLGTIYHAVMEAFFRNMQKEHLSWEHVRECAEERQAMIRRLLQEELADAGNIFYESQKNRELLRRAEELLDVALRVASEQMSAGSFRTAGVEANFGVYDPIPAIDIPLDHGIVMRIQGKIDRIDVAEGEVLETDDGDACTKRMYVNVIDYKSGNAAFDETKLNHGLQMQLAIYMKAAKAFISEKYPEVTVTPGGIYYFHLDYPFVEGAISDGDEEIFRKIMKEMRLKGAMNRSDDYFDKMEGTNRQKASAVMAGVRYTREGALYANTSCAYTAKQLDAFSDTGIQQAKRLGERIYEGHTLVNPYKYKTESPCTYCTYRSICGFDGAVPGYRYRGLRKREVLEVWDSNGQSNS